VTNLPDDSDNFGGNASENRASITHDMNTGGTGQENAEIGADSGADPVPDCRQDILRRRDCRRIHLGRRLGNLRRTLRARTTLAPPRRPSRPRLRARGGQRRRPTNPASPRRRTHMTALPVCRRRIGSVDLLRL
jgi:hypothetical protein